MQSLPVIIGMGGVNAAGRTSGHHGYRRMVLDSLPPALQQQTLLSLATMMGLLKHTADGWQDAAGRAFDPADIDQRHGALIRAATLIRKISLANFDSDATPWQSRLKLRPENDAPWLQMDARDVPQPLPAGWTVHALNEKQVQVTLNGARDFLVPSVRDFPVKAAGSLPEGFAPGALYNSRFQPRGLQMTIFGASDALASMGIEWDVLRQKVRPDQIGVYSGSGFGQLEQDGLGGMLQNRLQGERVTSRQLPMGINSMPTDFISAYVLGNVGTCNTSTGACASFLYNLRLAVDDIRSGRVRVAVVGNAEAPINPWIMEGFNAMGALASDEALRKLDGLGADQTPDHRRASRPFGENCGFTIGEAAQYFVLCDDALALEAGTQILGSISDVFVNADGFKKSITAPGIGNYLTFAKAVAAGDALAGRAAMQRGSFILAHGSSTPQNRTTESRIFDTVARAFDIHSWPVVAVKAYVGHTIAPASGDQLAVALGMFEHGVLPGVKTIDRIATDVFAERLNIPTTDLQLDPERLAVAILNSKGFGGNNASACVIAPGLTRKMMAQRHGQKRFDQYQRDAEHSQRAALDYDEQASRGEYRIRYCFGEGMIDEDALTMNSEQLQVPGFDHPVLLRGENPFSDML